LKDISFEVHPKSDKNIKYYRRSQGKAGNINKIFSDGESRNAHNFSNTGTNTKNLPFNIVSQPVHYIKYNYSNLFFTIRLGKGM
jgi:hypothetical protein